MNDKFYSSMVCNNIVLIQKYTKKEKNTKKEKKFKIQKILKD